MIEHEINRLKPIKAQVNSNKEKCTNIKSSSDKRTCFSRRSSINSLLLLFVFSNLFLVSNSSSQKSPRDLSSTRQNRVLLIALGGFRHDLVESYNLKNFAQFVEESSRASHLNPQFTTQSFPNLWSIATGAYVESHGIVANRFYDPLYNEYFHENGRNSKKWWNSTLPLWTYSVRKGLKTGVYHWPGSEIDFERQEQSYYQEPIENRRESLYKSIPHNENTPLETKLNRSVKWLSEEGYKLVCVHHNQPDAIAKKYGPNSPEFNVSLTQLDHSFGALIDSLKSSGLYNANDFNLVVVSDHGFTSIRKHVFVNEYLNESDARIWSFSATLIHLKPLISLDALLQKVAKMPGITVTMRNRMPDRLHYKSSRRIGEIIISALEGVVFIYMTRAPIDVNGRSVQLTYDQEKMLLLAASDKAAHGYDPIYPSMKGVFWAHGAAFKDAYNPGTPVDNVDVYSIICRVLDVECETRNGSLDNVVHFLKPHYQARFLDSGNLDYAANRAAVFSSRVKIDRLFLLMLYFYLVF